MADEPRDVPVTVVRNGLHKQSARVPDGEPNGNGNGHGAIEVEVTVPTSIVKRDGRVVPFEVERIEAALAKCFGAFGRTPATPVSELARRVVNIISAKSGPTGATV